MAKTRTLGSKNNGIVKLKSVLLQKLQKSLPVLSKKPASDFGELDEQVSDDWSSVPEDVKEGHFAVLAYDDGEPKRFIVALSYLTHPPFLRLLELAEEEFGFDQEGILTIPCRSIQLERILAKNYHD